MLLSQYKSVQAAQAGQSHAHLAKGRSFRAGAKANSFTGPESNSRYGNGCVRHLISEQVIRIVSVLTAQCIEERLGV
ncbi:uncharacterized protein Bfra_008678 [Botrytis fragariae]|uniref:Uncharacterized protein n=1 Tax=Botrytis fragariae TaxID=1964551 RepID=A0A8H6AQT3_9HELO|nr:uncharacterized protein Bfra_008678 [Botrytis fragariae]KAF5871655.1 hypothetical protein Bfra_008678 [Botrytis fragariae]